jgi:hypothetical protein
MVKERLNELGLVAMSAEDLLKLVRQRPFVPFVVVTTDGTRYEIRHPEFLMPLRRHVIIGVPSAPAEGVPETSVYLSLLHVQRVDIREPAET